MSQELISIIDNKMSIIDSITAKYPFLYSQEELINEDFEEILSIAEDLEIL